MCIAVADKTAAPAIAVAITAIVTGAYDDTGAFKAARFRAGVTIIARSGVCRKYTSCRRFAAVVGAWVIVITDSFSGAFTGVT